MRNNNEMEIILKPNSNFLIKSLDIKDKKGGNNAKIVYVTLIYRQEK